jgi:hypothetical protein
MKIVFPHRSSIFRYAMVLGCSVLLLGSATPRCAAQTSARVETGEAIPQERYKSWSLFLISNPEWLLDQSNDKLNALYTQFNVFGDAIGPDNVAVWFWSHPPELNQLHKAVDVTRSVAFCRLLKLKPSEGPYVLVMTEYPGKSVVTDYPDSFPKKSSNLLVIKLNGTDAASTTRLLGDLVDGLVTEDLSKLRPKADDYWRAWRKVFGNVSNTVVGLSSKVTVAFDAGPVKTEIKLGP